MLKVQASALNGKLDRDHDCSRALSSPAVPADSGHRDQPLQRIVIMLLAQPEVCLAGGTGQRLLVTTDGCSVSSFPGRPSSLVLASRRISPTQLDELRFRSIRMSGVSGSGASRPDGH